MSALVVVRNGSAWLAECLDAIAGQTVRPDRVLVVDVASTDTSLAIARAHSRLRSAIADVRLLTLDSLVPVGRAINQGVAVLAELADPLAEVSPASDSAESVGLRGPDGHDWLWVVHDDSAPYPTALARLLEAVRRSPSVGVAGPKLVDWDDPRRLVGLGIQVTRTGRHLAAPARGEADQGQHDSRTDVLAVSSSGMLVRRDVLDELGGFDPSFEEFGGDLDLGWRAQLAGYRVVVVPGAVIREASASADGERPGGRRASDVRRRDRTASRAVALARSSPLTAPFVALWIMVTSVFRAVALLVAKRPRHAWRELGDIGVLSRVPAVVGAWWRGRRTRRLQRSHIGSLFVAPSTAARSTLDAIQEAILPERARIAREAAPTTETGPSADESESLGGLPASLARRLMTHAGFLSVLATLVVSTVAWRSSISAGALSPQRTGVAGGELRPIATDSDGLWHAYSDAWHGAGLGAASESGPHLAVLAGLSWLAERLPGVGESRSPAAVAVGLTLFVAPALSAGAAYLAGRVVTRSRVARAVAAFAWGTSAVLGTAVADGRVTVVLAHALLPLAVAGHALASRATGTFTGAFATALVIAALGALAPPLLAVSTAAALVLLVVAPGTRRLRALVLLLVPVGLLGPWLLTVVDDWRRLLSGPGLVSTDAPPAVWGLLLGRPDAASMPLSQFFSESLSGTAALGLALIPVVLLGVAGFAVRARSRAESVGLAAAAVLGLIGLAGAAAASRVVLGSAETGIGASSPARLWPGVLLDLWICALLVGILAATPVLLSALRRARGRWMTSGAAAVLIVLAAGLLGQAAAFATTSVGRTLSVGRATLPAVAVEQSADPLSNRLLLLRPSDDVVDFALVGREPGDLLRDLDRAAPASDPTLERIVGELLGGRTADSLDVAELARLGIGFLQVRTTADSPLARRLDAAEGLTRLGTDPQGILWKVLPLTTAPGSTAVAPSRLRIVDGSDRLLAIVPTAGPHGATNTVLPARPSATRLVAAQPLGWARHAVVALDGRRLPVVPGEAQPTYVVPPMGGTLTIDLQASRPWWRLGQAALLLVSIFMALPFGNRRSRRPQ